MDGFMITGAGFLGATPKLESKGTDRWVNLALMRDDFAGVGKPKSQTTLYVTAFGDQASVLAGTCRKGDQLLIRAEVRQSNYVDGDTGATVYRHSYILRSFEFGAPGKEKRAEFAKAS
jgi:single-strand DNA-binding protein